MEQLHKPFTVEQSKFCHKATSRERRMSRAEVEERLNIGDTRFFALLKE